MNEATWLPNLVGGTSIWKLAVDLNEPKFFDGRLLVPETEGSESLPVTVRWDLTGLVPLSEARKTSPADVDGAIKSFQACLDRVAKVFATPNSGFDKYKDAFTVPSLDADGGANYLYSPEKKKLFVINWGASPRSMGGKAEYVFGYEDWGKHWGHVAAPVAAVAAAVATGDGAGATSDAPPAQADAKKEDETKKAAAIKGRPWWIWPLFGLVLITLLLLALFLLKACDDPARLPTGGDASNITATDGATPPPDAGAEGDAAGAGGGSTTPDGSTAGDGGDGKDTHGDAGVHGDAGAPADGGAHADGGTHADGGRDDEPDDDDLMDGPSGKGGGASSGAGASSSGGGSGGGETIVKTFPGGGQRTGVHRKHYSDEATTWRITAPTNKVSRTEQRAKRFDVWLMPGQSFEGVKVEWQDKAGKWHVH